MGGSFTMFFGFLRAGEITVPSDTAYDEGAHLVAVDSYSKSKSYKNKIKASKTDPFCLQSSQPISISMSEIKA